MWALALAVHAAVRDEKDGERRKLHDPAPLYDGRADPPRSPWVAWNYVGFFAETSPVNYLLIDTFRTRNAGRNCGRD